MPKPGGHKRSRAAKPNSKKAALPHLTPRQREVLQGLAAGFTYGLIAERLGLSTATVRTYVSEIYAALGVHKAAAAAHVAARLGLLGAPRGSRRGRNFPDSLF